VPVQLGISDGAWTEVKSGNLKEGQPVILGTLSKDASAASASPFGGTSQRRGPGF
jgi:hypothetical protein